MGDTPLVLLHGWGMTPRTWNGLRICLSPRIVATPALRGHDGSASPGPDLAAWSDSVLTNLPSRCVLGGWSLGALIALDLARRHPGRIDALVLFGATPRFVSGDGWSNGLEAGTVDGFTGGFANDAESTLRRFLALQAMGESQRCGVVHSLSRAAVSPGEGHPAALADGLKILASSDLRAVVPAITQPVRLIHGRNDTVMPLAAAEWLAGHMPHARLDILEACGHAPMISQPEACAQIIEEALRG